MFFDKLWHLWKKNELISVIVVAYNMERELPRTLYSLSTAYQKYASELQYEVIVVDNGSDLPFGEARVKQFGKYFRYHYIENAPSSPAYALNLGAKLARGNVLCFMIDGARIVSPGVLWGASCAFRAFNNPVVGTIGMHLGSDVQNLSVQSGYDSFVEDDLLTTSGWKEDGYRLFDISVFAESCKGGWFAPIAESNALFMLRRTFQVIGGVDERFDMPGGGYVNLDFFRRAVLSSCSEYVLLLGEATFHQVHGGVATNAGKLAGDRGKLWREQYQDLSGKVYSRPDKRPIMLGRLPDNPESFFLSNE